MKIIFLGTPDFAVPSLEKLIRSKHELLAVVCQPDKASGRGLDVVFSPVKTLALNHGLSIFQFEKISRDGVDELKKLKPDLMVTCAYGQMLSQQVLDIAKYGVINVHGSLLPKYRGAAPIQSAILNGDKVTGITIMQTVLAMDAGDILSQREIEILPDETGGELFERMKFLGADLLLETIDNLLDIQPQKQDEKKATFCKKLTKENSQIDFSKSSLEVVNLVRAFNPFPVATCNFFGEQIKVYKAQKCDYIGICGQILICNEHDGLIVGTKDGSVRLSEIQLAGKKKMQDTELLRGKKDWQK